MNIQTVLGDRNTSDTQVKIGFYFSSVKPLLLSNHPIKMKQSG